MRRGKNGPFRLVRAGRDRYARPPMRVRSLLLGVCMVVVPALALFSHHVPPEVAAAVRALASGRSPAWSGGAPRAAAGADAAAVSPPPPAEAPATVSAPAESGRRVIEARLLELGATAIECQPLPGAAGTLLASCRVAADASGQLQRLFQAVGPEPTAALDTLRADVEAWRRRTASVAPAGPR